MMSESDPEEFFDCDEEELEVKVPSSVSDNNIDGVFNHEECSVSSLSMTEINLGENGINGHGKDHCDYSNGTNKVTLRRDTEKSVWGGRCCLPQTMIDRNDFSVWSILKQCIGKELSKITMPIVFNEPLSFLQRVVEYMEYAYLLKRACDCDDPIERHELVTAFAVSATASNWDRLGKPFNPLLFETYEFNREDLGYKIVCEQVSHHPPISAFHVESDSYTFSGSIDPKIKFWGKSVEVTPKGLVTLYLKKHNEAYSWQNVNCCVHNIIVGKIWIEHYGAMEITNHKTNYRSVINFRSCGWFGKDLHRIDGHLFDERKRKLKAFYGKWVDSIFSFDLEDWNEYVKQSANQTDSQPRINPAARERSSAEQKEQKAPPTKMQLTKAQSEPVMTFSDKLNIPDEITVRKSSCDLHLPSQKLLWIAIPKPSDSHLYYSFTHFAMMLNEWDDKLTDLPPTDCRLRPDMRKMEDGLISEASEEKNRIEEKQRAARKERRKQKEEPEPLWFQLGINPYTGKEDWLHTGEYWKRDWSRCPDIY